MINKTLISFKILLKITCVSFLYLFLLIFLKKNQTEQKMNFKILFLSNSVLNCRWTGKISMTQYTINTET